MRRSPLPSGLRRCRGVFFLDLTPPGGERIRRSLRTRDRAEAEEWFAAERKRILGEIHGVTRPESRIDVFLPRYLEHARLVKSPARLAVDRVRLERFFAHAAVRDLGELRPEHLTAFFAARLDESPRPKRETVLQHLQVVRTALRWGVRLGYLERSPSDRVDWAAFRPDMERRRITYLTAEERERLLLACDGPLRTAVAIAVYAGLRLSEILYLDREDVDFGAALVLVRAKEREGWRPKTRCERSLPLFPALAAVLAPVTPSGRPWCPNENGERMTRREALRALKAAGVRAGVPRVTWQELRHTFATTLASAGVPIFSVSRWLGHTSTRTTEKFYSEFVPHGPTVEQAGAALGSPI